MKILLVLAATAAIAVPAVPATAGPAERGSFVNCGTYDLGYTEADVKAHKMRCAGAKVIFRKWQRKVDCGGDGPCTRTRVENFVCRFGGTDYSLRLRCTHRTRDRAMKGHWVG